MNSVSRLLAWSQHELTTKPPELGGFVTLYANVPTLSSTYRLHAPKVRRIPPRLMAPRYPALLKSKSPGWQFEPCADSRSAGPPPPAERNSNRLEAQPGSSGATLLRGRPQHPRIQLSAHLQDRRCASDRREQVRPARWRSGKRLRSTPVPASPFLRAGTRLAAAPTRDGTNKQRAFLRLRRGPTGSGPRSEAASTGGRDRRRWRAGRSFPGAGPMTGRAADY